MIDMIWISVILILAVLVIWLIQGFQWQIETTLYKVEDPSLPDGLEGMKIVQISDLHSCLLPDLFEMVQLCNPDLIICTGDIFDGVHGAEIAFDHLTRFAKQYPVYMVTGNHEKYLKSWPEWKEKVKEAGVHVLENETVRFDYHGCLIEIAGIDDFGTTRHEGRAMLKKQLKNAFEQIAMPHAWRLLLFHRASLLDEVPEEEANLVCAGHLHGGQWRIFGIGICGPGNLHRLALFPKHSGGLYYHGSQIQIVSRGLGDRMRIPRFYNPPELVCIELHKHAQD